MSGPSLTGGCLCGSVRYETAAQPFDAAFCHCRSCRRSAAAHAVAWVSVDRDSLRWTGIAMPASFVSSPGVLRQFCGRCGTPLTYASESSAGTVDLTVCSLDMPDAVVPVAHLWMEDAVSWDSPCDGLPCLARTRAQP